MLNEDYDISIIGKQSLDGESDEISLNTVGSYICRGNARYITYKEFDPDSPDSVHTSVLKVENECVTIMSGQSDTRLILEKGKRHRCCYDTGFGSLTLTIFTNTFYSDLKDSGGKLNVKYTLDIDSSLSSCNEIIVNVRKRPVTQNLQAQTQQLPKEQKTHELYGTKGKRSTAKRIGRRGRKSRRGR